MQKSLHFRKADMIAIALVLVLAVLIFLCFLPGKDAPAAAVQVYQDGKLIRTLPLDQPTELVISGPYTNTITIRDGKVAITCSDCPGEDCVESGWIHSSGRSIVCLPNALELRVVAQSGDVDFVVG